MRRFFDKQHVKPAQTLLKSASQHLYHIHWSLRSQLSWEKSLLLTRKALWRLVNTLSPDDNYPVLNTDNWTIPVQMQLSKKRESFSEFFSAFLKSKLDFEYFEKKMTLRAFVFPKLWGPKTWLVKCLESPVWEDSSTRNMVNIPKYYGNLHQSTFIIFTDRCQVSCAGKSLSYWHAEPWDCLLTHSLSMRSILFLIETI